MIEGKDGAEMECLFYRLNPEHKKAIINEADALITGSTRDEVETKAKRHCNSVTAVSCGAELQKHGTNTTRAMR